MTRVGLVMAGGGRSEVSGGWQRSPEPRHPDETELRHPGYPGPWHTLDHGAWHPGNAAHEDSTARADTEHGCNREARLVIRRRLGTLQTKTGAADLQQLFVTIMRGGWPRVTS